MKNNLESLVVLVSIVITSGVSKSKAEEVSLRQPPTFSDVLKSYTDNSKRIMESAETLSKSLENQHTDNRCAFAFEACRGRDALARQRCYVVCLTLKSEDEHIPLLYPALLDVVQTWCGPLQTTLEKIFDKGESSVSVKFDTYKNFRYLLGISSKSMSYMIDQISSGLLRSIILNVNTPFKPLRRAIGFLKGYLTKTFPNASYSVEYNPGCQQIVPKDTYDVYLKSMQVDSAMESTMVPGFFLLSTVSKYLNAKASFKLRALMEFTRLVTGSTAGFGCAEKGRVVRLSNLTDEIKRDTTETFRDHAGNGLCDELGKEYILGYPVPPIIGNGVDYSSISGPKC